MGTSKAKDGREWPDSQLMLTVEEAARVLRLSRTTTYGLIRDGLLRPVKIGRNTRLTMAELKRYVAELEAGSFAGTSE